MVGGKRGLYLVFSCGFFWEYTLLEWYLTKNTYTTRTNKERFCHRMSSERKRMYWVYLVMVVVRQPMGGWTVLKGCPQQTKNSWWRLTQGKKDPEEENSKKLRTKKNWERKGKNVVKREEGKHNRNRGMHQLTIFLSLFNKPTLWNPKSSDK